MPSPPPFGIGNLRNQVPFGGIEGIIRTEKQSEKKAPKKAFCQSPIVFQINILPGF